MHKAEHNLETSCSPHGPRFQPLHTICLSGKLIDQFSAILNLYEDLRTPYCDHRDLPGRGNATSPRAKLSRMARVQGAVSVRFAVDSSYKAHEIHLDGNKLLSTSVLFALNHTNFPAECKGQKVDAVYTFELEDIPAKERGSSLVLQSPQQLSCIGKLHNGDHLSSSHRNKATNETYSTPSAPPVVVSSDYLISAPPPSTDFHALGKCALKTRPFHFAENRKYRKFLQFLLRPFDLCTFGSVDYTLSGCYLLENLSLIYPVS